MSVILSALKEQKTVFGQLLKNTGDKIAWPRVQQPNVSPVRRAITCAYTVRREQRLPSFSAQLRFRYGFYRT